MFVKIFTSYIKRTFNINDNSIKFYSLILDSCSDSKISYHLIFRIININKDFEIWLKNNYFTGLLIKDFIIYANSVLLNDSSQMNLLSIKFLNLNEKKNFLIMLDDIDLSVYSKNRCFRIYESCKKGKNIYLKYSNASIIPEDCKTEYEVFNLSMITRSYRNKFKIIEYKNHNDNNYNIIGNNINEIKKMYRYKTTRCIEPVEKLLYDEKYESIEYNKVKSYNNHEEKENIICKCCNKLVIEPYLPRECPNFINDFFGCYCRDKKEIYLIIPRAIPHIYTLRTKSKSCFYKENPNIPHKFNHIYFMLDTKNSLFFFKCHDYDCIKIIEKSSNNYIKYKNDELNKRLDNLYLKKYLQFQ